MTNRLQNQISVSGDALTTAMRERRYEVHYQPILETESGVVAGVEALVRWVHPTQGIVMPDDFTHRMEWLSLTDEFTWIVANESLRDLVSFSELYGRPLRLSLSVAAVNLGNLLFPDILAGLVEAFNLTPEQVVLQVSEGGLIKNMTSSLDVLTRLRLKHFQISMDDFRDVPP